MADPEGCGEANGQTDRAAATLDTIVVDGRKFLSIEENQVVHSMKLRPVLLVLLLLSGFYYLTTHVASTGALAPWLMHRACSTRSQAPKRSSGLDGERST